MFSFFKKFFSKITINPEALAKQLRQPSGFLGKKVGAKMNESNAQLYSFAMELMKVSDHESILEIGFGNGKFFGNLFTKANGIKISGIDFSETMISEARKNNKKFIKGGRLDLRFGNSDQLPYPDNSFDKVFCINVIYFWEDPSAHLKEIQRVLKPGGKFYAVIRTKDSMLRLPFVKFGFKVYEEQELNDILKRNKLEPCGTARLEEQEVESNGEKYRLSSMCIIGCK